MKVNFQEDESIRKYLNVQKKPSWLSEVVHVNNIHTNVITCKLIIM